MSDAVAPLQPATRDARIPVNRDLFLSACAAKGCATDEDRAQLLGITRKNVYNYRRGLIVPLLPTARRIAGVLEVDIDELWPAA